MSPEDREREITEAFVSLATSLATGYDVVDLLTNLTGECARLLDIASAGLLLADQHRTLHVLAASSERTRLFELFQLQAASGPCLDCYRGGAPVLVADISAAADQWPRFVSGARVAGFASVHALPLRLGDEVLGALGLFGTSVGVLNDRDLSLGRALADVATVALVQDKATADAGTRNEQLQRALTSRVVVEQAKGVLAQRGNLDMVDAFKALRRYSRDHNLKLTDVSQDIVTRAVPPQVLLDHFSARNTRTR